LYDIVGLVDVLSDFAPGKTVKVRAKRADGTLSELDATVRIDTPQEVQYYQHGGILQYVLRQLLQGK
jgi:aconitate hydratase